jgi:DNA-directed RNA polymerase specialized sigma24 family protein
MTSGTDASKPTDRIAEHPDRIAGLIESYAAGGLGEAGKRELAAAVHQAIFPMCLSLLHGDAEAARDVEQETWWRLLDHLRNRGPDAAIVHGAAYVRGIARRLCYEPGRRGADPRNHVPVDDLNQEHLSTGAPAWADRTTASARTALERLLAGLGYDSRRLLTDLNGLSTTERLVLALRQQNMPDKEIAHHLDQNIDAVQKAGERSMRHIRGRIHVIVWQQVPLTAWTLPPCPQLAALKTAVRDRLRAGADLRATLLMDIGQHLDPSPNRRAGTAAVPVCRLCLPERKRSERAYLMLIATLPPLFALPAAVTPTPTPTSYHPTTPPGSSHHTRVPVPGARPAGHATSPPPPPRPAAPPPSPGPAAGGRRPGRRQPARRRSTLAVLLLLSILFGCLMLLRPEESRGAAGQVAAGPARPLPASNGPARASDPAPYEVPNEVPSASADPLEPTALPSRSPQRASASPSTKRPPNTDRPTGSPRVTTLAPPNQPPAIGAVETVRNPVGQKAPDGNFCLNGGPPPDQQITAEISDPDDDIAALDAYYTYYLPNGSALTHEMSVAGDAFAGPQFTIPYSDSYSGGGTVEVEVHVEDSHGNEADPVNFAFELGACNLVPNPN